MTAKTRQQEPLAESVSNEPIDLASDDPPSESEVAEPEVCCESEVLRSAIEVEEASTLPPSSDRLDQLATTVTEGFAGILQVFEDKLAFDEAKERQITRLHNELQEYRGNLVAKTKRPLILGLVRLHDDLGKVLSALRRRPAEELTPERFFRSFDGFSDDLELLLAQHGVEPFMMPGETFDPKRQTALRTEITDDAAMAGVIAARLRPGFEEGEVVLQKERVAVYAAQAPTTAPPLAPRREDPIS